MEELQTVPKTLLQRAPGGARVQFGALGMPAEKGS